MTHWHDIEHYEAFVGWRSWHSTRSRATHLAEHFQDGELKKSSLHYDYGTRITKVTVSQNDYPPTNKVYELAFSVDELAECKSLEEIENLLTVCLAQALIAGEE